MFFVGLLAGIVVAVVIVLLFAPLFPHEAGWHFSSPTSLVWRYREYRRQLMVQTRIYVNGIIKRDVQ